MVHQQYGFHVFKKTDKSHGFYGVIDSDLRMFGGWKNLTDMFPLNWWVFHGDESGAIESVKRHQQKQTRVAVVKTSIFSEPICGFISLVGGLFGFLLLNSTT